MALNRRAVMMTAITYLNGTAPMSASYSDKPEPRGEIYLLWFAAESNGYVGRTIHTAEERYFGRFGHQENAQISSRIDAILEAIRRNGDAEIFVLEQPLYDDLASAERSWIAELGTYECGLNETAGSDGASEAARANRRWRDELRWARQKDELTRKERDFHLSFVNEMFAIGGEPRLVRNPSAVNAEGAHVLRYIEYRKEHSIKVKPLGRKSTATGVEKALSDYAGWKDYTAEIWEKENGRLAVVFVAASTAQSDENRWFANYISRRHLFEAKFVEAMSTDELAASGLGIQTCYVEDRRYF